MISEEKLKDSIAAGIITDEQFIQLTNFARAADGELTGGSSEEPLRFIRSFGDVFITIGVAFIAGAFLTLGLQGVANLLPVLLFALTAEWITRKQRMALPSIALFVAILFFAGKALTTGSDDAQGWLLPLLTLVSLLFYWRHRMPFAMAALVAGAIASIALALKLTDAYIVTCFGLLVFGLAMYFDRQDVARETSDSDCGFWLHLLAAPKLVHGVMVTLFMGNADALSALASNLVILIFVLVFFAVALFVDRRALLVSSLSYALAVFIKLVKDQMPELPGGAAMIFIVFGFFVLFSGVYWYRLRQLAFGWASASPLARWVPDLQCTSKLNSLSKQP